MNTRSARGRKRAISSMSASISPVGEHENGTSYTLQTRQRLWVHPAVTCNSAESAS